MKLKKTVAALLLLCICCVFPTSCAEGKAEKIIKKAEKYLDENSYGIVITSSVTSTDSSISEALGNTASSMAVTFDGDSYRLESSLGDERITRLYVGGVLYTDESVIGLLTKQVAKNDSTKTAWKNEYTAGCNIEIKLSDYEKIERTKASDGSVTITCGMIAESVVDSFEKRLKEELGINEADAEISLDRERTTLTVTVDEEGRYTDIKEVCAMSLLYKDGYRALISMNTDREYVYGATTVLSAPDNAEAYVELGGDYKGVFGDSFSMTTNIITWETTSDEVKARLSGLGMHNILYVDGDNYRIVYPNTNKPEQEGGIADGVEIEITVVDGIEYYKEKATYNGESYEELIKKELNDSEYSNNFATRVFGNVFHVLARNFNSATVTQADGATTVTFVGFSEDYYNSLLESFNYYSSDGVLLIPDTKSSSYTVKIDSEGRYVESNLEIYVTPYDPEEQILYNAEYIRVQKIFDFATAEQFYEDSDEGAKWITAPENADEYLSGQ